MLDQVATERERKLQILVCEGVGETSDIPRRSVSAAIKARERNFGRLRSCRQSDQSAGACGNREQIAVSLHRSSHGNRAADVARLHGERSIAVSQMKSGQSARMCNCWMKRGAQHGREGTQMGA